MGIVIIFQFEEVVSKDCALNPLMKTGFTSVSSMTQAETP